MTTQNAAPAAKAPAQTNAPTTTPATGAPPATPTPAANTEKALTPRAQREREIRILLEKCTSQIAIALPSTGNTKPEAIVRAVLTEVRMSADLVACEPKSIVRCALEAASLGLIPNRIVGHFYLVPFNDTQRGVKVCTSIIGYRGLIDLARRSGNISTFDVYVVHEKDDFTYRLGDDAKIEHVPYQPKAKNEKEADPGHMIAVYAIVRLRDGGVQRLVMTTREVDMVRAKALSKNSPAWTGHYEEMAKKTVVRRIAKLLPISVEALHLIEKDRVRDEGTEAERQQAPPEDEESIDLSPEDVTVTDPKTGETVNPQTGEVTKPAAEGAAAPGQQDAAAKPAGKGGSK